MPRYKILIEYDGTNFSGWQIQGHAVSIQGEINKAIFQFSGEEVEVYGSGRTDAGVHAIGQVAHFDLVKEWQDHTIINATNYHLRPNRIVLLDCKQVPEEFHARFSATQRTYKYIILNRPARPSFETNRVWHVREPLDTALMESAAKLFEGMHDFTSLKTRICQAKSYLKTIDYIKISKDGVHIEITITARSFIHNMVRNIVGMLAMIGTKKWTEKNITSLLDAKAPTSQKLTAPAHGLYLERIDF
jgi:tRNA pseudouridine38-40 synthase